MRRSRPRGTGREGYAVLAVLLVLLALFLLATPYLVGIRRADRESERVFDRTAARLALDDAARHARAELDATHPALDVTPYWDSAEELSVDNALEPEFVDARTPVGVQWDLATEDLAGRIDLASASPGAIANLIGEHTWLGAAAAGDDASLDTASTRGFPPQGFLWVRGERLAFLERSGTRFGRLERGLFGAASTASTAACDESEGRSHPAGAPVLGYAAFALAEWRLRGPGGSFRAPADLDQVAEAFEASLVGALGPAAFEELALGATVFGEVGAGPRWQRPARLVQSVTGGLDCRLEVDDGRWFNPGTTVRVSGRGVSELALVRAAYGGDLELAGVLRHDYDAFGATVQPLARRPVNLNTASEEVLRALFLGLKLLGRNARITDGEAVELVEAVVGARPFTGFEDFLDRVVLPAAGVEKLEAGESTFARVGADGFLDPEDAEALYLNGLNANDARLEFSTMPFAFTTRGAFGLALRTSVNAKSGVERARLERDQVEVIVPQRELMALWSRQADFDEELRLTRDAAHWATGPEATSRGTGETTPPSRAWAHLGTVRPGELEGELNRTFASRDAEGWAQLHAVRTDDAISLYHSRTVEHFDTESSDLEGRDLSVAGSWQRTTHDEDVDWTAGPGELLRPFSFSMWMKPQRRSVGELHFDLGDVQYQDTDRVMVVEEAAELEVRVLDAAGDHPDTAALEEQTVVRVPIEHFPLDTWTHLAIDVRGTRPDQVTVLVDGMARGETDGLTRLDANLSETDTVLRVESTAGFGAVGDRCVVRIGEELIEAEVAGPDTLHAIPHTTGEAAGIGGRAARERERWSQDGSTLLSEGSVKDRSHPIFAPVELFGYSRPLRSEAPDGSVTLQSPVGPFAVAVVTGVEGGDTSLGDVVLVNTPTGPVPLGHGMRGQSSNVTGLVLARADDPEGGDGSFLAAFDRRGGFALLVQHDSSFQIDAQLGGGVATETINGAPLGGAELVRYSGLSGNTLLLSGRGTPVLQMLQDGPASQGADDFKAYVTDYSSGVSPPLDEQLEKKVFVVPISMPADGVFGGQLQFLEDENGLPEYAQITRRGSLRHLTEWIAYDEIAAPFGGTPAQFVRSDARALARVFALLVRDRQVVTLQDSTPPSEEEEEDVDPVVGEEDEPPEKEDKDEFEEGDTTGAEGGGKGGVDGGSTSGGSGGTPLSGGGASSFSLGPSVTGGLFAASALGPALGPAVAGPFLAQEGGLSALDNVGYWTGELGTAEDDQWFLSRAVRTVLGFRGVMGTHSHAHPVGTEVLPVFRLWRSANELGAPGAGDRAFLLDEHPASLGEPVVVHRAFLPDDVYRVFDWEPNGLLAEPGELATHAFEEAGLPDFDDQVFVALENRIGVPLVPSTNAAPTNGRREMRRLARLVKYPSGELPRVVESLAVGGDHRGPSRGRLPDSVVDELELGTTRFGQRITGTEAGLGAAMILAEAIGQGPATIEVETNRLRDVRGRVRTQVSPLGELPEEGGLLRIGEELLAWSRLDPQGTTITIAPGGRGMLGTEEQPHRIGEPVMFLSHLRATVLLADVGPADADLPLASLRGWPREGTLLVGEELVHFTRADRGGGPGLVGMPRASLEPGADDGGGGGLFRGRFGTTASAHGFDAPVVLFPARYWDRWTDRADAPELAFFGFSASQPDAWFLRTFFEEREARHPGPKLRLLVRGDDRVAWDDDPAERDGLWLFDGVTDDGRALSLGVQTDRLEWRVFVTYEPGSFDFATGLAHGWKTTPELRLLGAEYLAPRSTLFREER